MSCPPLLLGMTLVFWGWHTQVLPYAVGMALIVEAARGVPWRWELSDRDFNRITDLTSAALLVLIVYHFDRYSYHAIYIVLAQLPFVLLPLVASQVFSTREGVKLTALVLRIRRAVAKGQMQEDRSLDLRYPYLLVCLVSASAGQLRGPGLYLGLVGLVGVGLWRHRPRRYPPMLWIGLYAAAALGGYGAHQGVLELRWLMEPIVLEWFQERFWPDRDPYRAHTAIGAIGRLKLSDRIVLRVRPDGGRAAPPLLREASYQTFSHNLWLSGVTTFTELEPEGDGASWPVHPVPEAGRSVTVSAYLHRGRGLLVSPSGAYRIENLPVGSLSVNPLGALKVERGPGLVDYEVRYRPGVSFDLPPGEQDLGVPAYLEATMGRLAEALGLAGLAPEAALGRVQDYFARGFGYRLVLGPASSRQPLADFLERTRAGHCEYFATATVLLLRAAGIPARYATGYAVQEFSGLENGYIVRRRHGHAWALAYIDGGWRDVDTTPATWAAAESELAPWWEPMADLWSWSWYRFSRWRSGETTGWPKETLVGLLLVLAVLLALRVLANRRVGKRTGAAANSPGPRARPPGADSEFYRVEGYLRAIGGERGRGETLMAWVRRCEAGAGPLGVGELAREVLPLHYRYRFDPAGLSETQREALRARVTRWLERRRRRGASADRAR